MFALESESKSSRIVRRLRQAGSFAVAFCFLNVASFVVGAISGYVLAFGNYSANVVSYSEKPVWFVAVMSFQGIVTIISGRWLWNTLR